MSWNAALFGEDPAAPDTSPNNATYAQNLAPALRALRLILDGRLTGQRPRIKSTFEYNNNLFAVPRTALGEALAIPNQILQPTPLMFQEKQVIVFP